MPSRFALSFGILITIATGPVRSQGTWTYIPTPPDLAGIRTIHFLNEDTGFIAGKVDSIGSATPVEPGRLYMTVDGGSSWQLRISDSLSTLVRLTFPTDQLGFCVTEHSTGFPPTDSVRIYRTVDGGYSWSYHYIGLPCTSVIGFQFPSVLRGFFWGGSSCDQNIVYASVDSAMTWQVVPNMTGFYEMAFTSPAVGYKCGVGQLQVTNDIGLNWTPQTHPACSTIPNIAFADALNGVAAAIPSQVWCTSNGGQTLWWPAAVTNPPNLYNDIALSPVGIGLAVGGTGFAAKQLLSTDMGHSWFPVNVTGHYMTCISILDNGIAYIGGNFGVWRYTPSAVDIPTVQAAAVGIGIAPNPAQDGFWLAGADGLPQGARMHLYNANGQLVSEQALGSGPSWIDRRALPSGLYLCEVRTEVGIARARVILE